MNIFFLAAGFFLAIVWALQLDFYISLSNFSRNRKYAYFLVNIFRRIRKRNDAMNLFTLFRNISFFYWFVWEFLGHCSWVKSLWSCSGWTFCSLLVPCYFLLVTRHFLLVAHYFLFFTFYILLIFFFIFLSILLHLRSLFSDKLQRAVALPSFWKIWWWRWPKLICFS